MAAATEIMARPVPRWRQRTAVFWHWWTGELAQLMPDRLSTSTRVPLLSMADGDVVLVEPRSAAGPEARVAVSTLDAPAARAAVRELLVRAGETRSFARLRLRPDQVLVRRVTMPAATEENLPQVVAFEMDRLSPFRAEEVYHDQRVISRDPANAQVLVQIAVARREVVDAAVARLRDLGVNVRGVVVPEDAAPGASSLDLLPSEQREEREGANERLTKRVLWGVVGALLFAALLLPAWQKREAAIAMLPILAKAENDAKASDMLARELERQVGDYNYFLTKKYQTQALPILEEVSRLLPDNTWVQQLDLRTAGKGREVQITGETPSSSRLIELLEQSTLLQNAAPRGAVTRATQPGYERFMIAAEARQRPLPELRPAAELAALAPPAPPPAPIEPPHVEAPTGPPSKSGALAEDGGDADAEPKAPPVAKVEPAEPQRRAAPVPPPEAFARRDALREQAKQRAAERARILNDPRRQRPAPAKPPSQ
jgi:general secretion pathway protein L